MAPEPVHQNEPEEELSLKRGHAQRKLQDPSHTYTTSKLHLNRQRPTGTLSRVTIAELPLKSTARLRP